MKDKEPISVIIAPYIWCRIDKKEDEEANLVTITEAMDVDNHEVQIKITEIVYDTKPEPGLPDIVGPSISTDTFRLFNRMIVRDDIVALGKVIGHKYRVIEKVNLENL